MIKYLAPASPTARTPSPTPASVTQTHQMSSPIIATPEQVRGLRHYPEKLNLMLHLLIINSSLIFFWPFTSISYSRLAHTCSHSGISWSLQGFTTPSPRMLSDCTAAQWAGRSERQQQSHVRDANRNGPWQGRSLRSGASSGEMHTNGCCPRKLFNQTSEINLTFLSWSQWKMIWSK